MKAFKFKVKRPAKAIVQKFEQHFSLCRELYNCALQERIGAWKEHKISLNYFDQANQLTDIKIIRPEFKEIHSQIFQDVLKRLDKTFKAFFRRIQANERVGFPRFKGSNFFNSFCFPQKGFILNGNSLILSKIGKVKLHLSQTMLGKLKTCTIKREVSGWFVIFTVETKPNILPKTGKSIGIDVGIESFATLSDGTQIENFRYFESSQRRLRIIQRTISRQKKESQSRKKAIQQLRKIHQKVKNQRNDFTHKISSKIVKEFDLIAIEKLHILGLIRGKLAKQIHDAAWSSFFQKLKYKAENAGRELKEVNPRYTSQTCLCGKIETKNLSQRWHKCIYCGYENHRDIVSAQIILRLGQTAEMSSSEKISLKDLTYLNGESVSLESSTSG